MTDPPGFTALLPGNPNVTDGLRAWLLPSWITRLHMRQEGREGGSNCSWINVATEVRDVEVSRLRCDDGYWWEFLWVDHGRERTQGVR